MSSQATISLSAIRHNLQIARDHAPGCALLLAVKADAYGHGAVAVSSMVERTRTADWLGVAQVSEGRVLREAGITLPLLKLSGCLPDEVGAAIEAGLTLTVTDAGSIEQAEAAAARADRITPVHLKIDTGMGRIGAPPAQAVDLARLVDDSPHLVLDGLFTHFASADVRDDGGFSATQAEAFRQVAQAVQQTRGAVPWVHSANSAGVLFGDQRDMTMVRPGIMAYGLQPNASNPAPVDLRPACRWTSALSFVKWVEQGTPISYGSIWRAPRDTWIGTVPVGYGDGFSRANSAASDRPGGQFVIGARRRVVVGRVCMDQTMVDLGPDTPPAVGDEVVVIGTQGEATWSADDLAAVSSTISYEVLTAMAPRVVRVHTDE